jgi:hypothetical protein
VSLPVLCRRPQEKSSKLSRSEGAVWPLLLLFISLPYDGPDDCIKTFLQLTNK